jgi:hypothetical protein
MHFRATKRLGVLIALVAGFLSGGVPGVGLARDPVAEPPMTPDPLQTYAYATAVQAFIYALAPDGMYRRLSEEVLDPKTRKAGFNAFAHTSELCSPTLALFPAPNVDTIYSTAWLDVRNEPAVLSAPGTDGRYWTAQVLDFDSNTLTNFGARLDGTKAGTFAVVGPGWTGKLPEGITRSVQSPTGFVAVLLRVLVNGPDDLPTAVGFQKQFTQAALSRHTQGQTGPASNVIEGIPMHKADSPAERLAVLDRLLKLNPLRPGEEALMSQFATIGVGPGRVLLPIKPSKDTLKRAIADANTIAAEAGPKSGVERNGWLAVPKGMGTYGSDFLQRAAVWRGGALAQLPQEAFYPSVLEDSDGQPLDGSKGRYNVHFPAGQLPPTRFFWSISMYDLKDFNLVENPIKRYSIGDRTAGLQYGKDGSLTLYVQKDSPGKDKESNWLPAPDRPFCMTMRLYGASEEALDGTWKMPTVASER